MQNVAPSRITPRRVDSVDMPPVPEIDVAGTLRGILSGLWRQRWLIASTAVVFTVLGLYYALSATPRFTASASVLVDPRISTSPAAAPSAPTLLLSDNLLVDSEVKVLQSRELSSRLVERLGLADDPPPPEDPGLLTALADKARALLGGTTPHLPPLPDGQNGAITTPTGAGQVESLRRDLVRSLSVERSGETYVIDIRYTHEDPAFAARAVNGLLEEYFLFQAEEVLENTRRVSSWLSQRVEVLAVEVAAADAAVERYRRANQLYAVGNGGESLPSSVELASANEELIRTRNQIVDLSAEIGQLEKTIADGDINVSIAASSPSLARLRGSYLDAVERERELSARLGDDHELVRLARDDMERARSLIIEELGAIAAQLRARRATLETQAEQTGERIGMLQERSSLDEERSIRLRELEREAAAKRRLYQSLLEQLNETTQQKTFTANPARVIAAAIPPDRKSEPNTKLIAALSLFGGLVVGSGLAFLREQFNDAFLRAEDVEQGLSLPLFGIVPVIGDDLGHMHSAGLAAFRPPGRRRGARRDLDRLRFAADHSRSMFAETLRAVDAGLLEDLDEADRRGVVVGFTSTRKGEGKSTIAANFATVKAAGGYRTALVDLDMRGLGITRVLDALPRQNAIGSLLKMRPAGRENPLGRLLDKPSTVEELVPTPELSGAIVVSPGKHEEIVLSDLETLRRLGRVMGRLREKYDYVVVDLPPMRGLVDANVAASLVEKMVLVVEWGTVRREHLERLLAANARVGERAIGAVYSKVRLNGYAAYNGPSVTEYYHY